MQQAFDVMNPDDDDVVRSNPNPNPNPNPTVDSNFLFSFLCYFYLNLNLNFFVSFSRWWTSGWETHEKKYIIEAPLEKFEVGEGSNSLY